MTEREKLINLIMQRFDWQIAPETEHKIIINANLGELVDALISHGVTVKEMQKPIAETDLGKYIDTPVWFEELGRDVEELPLLLDGIGIYYAEFKEFGEIERLDRHIDDYNYQWRCWAEKPTEEERKAAEWEK